MSMLEIIIRALIYICCLALGFYLIVWVLAAIGLHFPPMVENIIMVILVLVAILVLFRLFAPRLGNFRWFP